LTVVVTAALVTAILFGAGCQTQKIVDPAKAEIIKNCEMMFIRLKAGDKLAIYDNEFPYLREDVDQETFLKHPMVAKYRVDTLYAMQIDSVTFADTLVGGKRMAVTALRMEYRLKNESLFVQQLNLRWFEVDHKWIKPSSTTMVKQNQFEEDIRIYQEAVKEKEKEESQGSTPDSSGK